MPSYTGTESTHTNFIVGPTSSNFECVGSASYDGATAYRTYTKGDNGIFSFIITRSNDNYQYDVFQGHVKMKAGTDDPAFIAFNISSFDDKGVHDGDYQSSDEHNGRAVGIYNPDSHKFVVKYYTGDTANNDWLIATGKAGFEDDGTPVDGSFAVRAADGKALLAYTCYANALPPITAGSDCTGYIANYITGTIDWVATLAYLEIDSADLSVHSDAWETLLVNGSVIGITAPISAADIPTAIQ